MDSGKVNWQNFLKKVSKDVQIVERSLAHDDEVSIDYQLHYSVLHFRRNLQVAKKSNDVCRVFRKIRKRGETR